MEREGTNPSPHFAPRTPPTTTISNSSSSSSSAHWSNGGGGGLPPLTPKSTSTSPCTTTFVQADTSSFKQVVQMLTGAPAAKQHTASSRPDPPPPPPSRTGLKKPSFKLYERRQSSFKGRLKINPHVPGLFNRPNSNPSSPHTASGGFSPRHHRLQEVLSPSTLDLPSLSLSPVTPLIPDPFHRPSSSSSEEERAVAEKGFCLLPSPRAVTPTDGAEPPRLLPLFPVTSPRVAGDSSATAASCSSRSVGVTRTG